MYAGHVPSTVNLDGTQVISASTIDVIGNYDSHINNVTWPAVSENDEIKANSTVHGLFRRV